MEVVVDVTSLSGRCFTDFNEACQFICKTKMLSTLFFKLNDKHVMVLSVSKQINSQLKPTHTPQEIIAMAEQLNTKRKVRADFDKSQPITVNVSGCSEDVKKQVIQAFFDVGLFWGTDDRNLSPADGYVCSYGNVCKRGENLHRLMWGAVAEGITPAEFFAMVYEDEPQGHPHAELMMAYAEDAKTNAEPWKLWQAKDKYMDNVWFNLDGDPIWHDFLSFRRKPKTHLVHGVEVPDLRFEPSDGDAYYYPSPESPNMCDSDELDSTIIFDIHKLKHNLCYEHTEAGKQAAILHAKAMLGIA